MKQVKIIAALLLLSFGTFAQTVTPNPGPYTPMAQKYQYPWIKTTGGVWNTGKFVQIDSAQFSGITYVPDAPVDDSSTQAANTRWIRQNISPGTPGTPTSVWQFLGNYSPTDPTLGRIGFIDSFPLSIITDNEIRITIPDNGIKRSAGLANKVLMIDTITKNVYYADAGGGGGGIDSTTLSDSLAGFIPLIGTLVGKPITGDIVFDNGTAPKRIKGNFADSYIEFSDDGTIGINQLTGSNVNVSGVDFSGKNDVSAFGMKGYKNYSANYDNLTYIQKVYADSLLALKLNISDTTNKWVQSVANNAVGDSLIVIKNGVRTANKYPSGSGWGLTGNATTAGASYLGTSNNTSLRVRTNEIERVIIDSATGGVRFAQQSVIIPGTLTSNFVGSILNNNGTLNIIGGNSGTGNNDVFFTNNTGLSYLAMTNNGVITTNSPITSASTATFGGVILNSNSQGGLKTTATYGLEIYGKSGTTSDFSFWDLAGTQMISGKGGRLLVGQYNSTFNTSAIADFVSTTKGFLPPRMTTTQRDAIASPATGLTVYNTTTNTNDTYLGGAWVNDLQSASPSFTGLLSGVGTTQTGSSAVGVVDLSQTWNTTGNVTGIKYNVTNTASGATSNLMDLQEGGVSMFKAAKIGILTVAKSQNTQTRLDINNTNSGSNATAGMEMNSDVLSGGLSIFKYSSTHGSYKTILAKDAGIYNTTTGGDMSFLNDFASGKIKFSAGGSSVVQVTLASTGNVLVGTSTDVASSKLTVESTTQGFLPPRMTTTQKNAIASPAAGLMVFDTTLAKLCVYTGAAWETITSL